MGEGEPDLLYYDNAYYGDWSVFSDDVVLKNEALAVRVQPFETAKAIPPSANRSKFETENDGGRAVAW